MSNEYTYLGFTFVEQDEEREIGEDVRYDIYVDSPAGPDERDYVATALRSEVDPDAAPHWGIEVFTDPGTTHWFRSRIDAIRFIKEAIG